MARSKKVSTADMLLILDSYLKSMGTAESKTQQP
jgi:hypothetical protein